MTIDLLAYHPLNHTATKSYLCVFPEKELRGHNPYLHIHACVCERFIYSQDRSAYFPPAELIPELNFFLPKMNEIWFSITRLKSHKIREFSV